MQQLLPDIGYTADRKFSPADSNIYTSIGRYTCKRSGVYASMCQITHGNIFQSRNMRWDVYVEPSNLTLHFQYDTSDYSSSTPITLECRPVFCLLLKALQVFLLCVCANGIT